VCRMFEELGTSLLTKLQGSYSFCLYDKKLVRCCFCVHLHDMPCLGLHCQLCSMSLDLKIRVEDDGLLLAGTCWQ
jgi:hypothetical protein